MRTLSVAAPGSPGAICPPRAWASAPGKACCAQLAVGLPTYATSGVVSTLTAPIRNPEAAGDTAAVGKVLQAARPAAAKAPKLKSAARRVKTYVGMSTSLDQGPPLRRVLRNGRRPDCSMQS